MRAVYVILHNVRSALNVGAIFRSAEAIGVSKVYLIGYTPAPIDRFGRPQPEIAKTALGAETIVPWESREDALELIVTLRNGGVTIVSVEQSENAIDYKQYELVQDTAFIFGNEIEGISKEILDQSDTIIAIPMRGTKESLNVSTAAGIILFRLLDK